MAKQTKQQRKQEVIDEIEDIKMKYECAEHTYMVSVCEKVLHDITDSESEHFEDANLFLTGSLQIIGCPKNIAGILVGSFGERMVELETEEEE